MFDKDVTDASIRSPTGGSAIGVDPAEKAVDNEAATSPNDLEDMMNGVPGIGYTILQKLIAKSIVQAGSNSVLSGLKTDLPKIEQARTVLGKMAVIDVMMNERSYDLHNVIVESKGRTPRSPTSGPSEAIWRCWGYAAQLRAIDGDLGLVNDDRPTPRQDCIALCKIWRAVLDKMAVLLLEMEKKWFESSKEQRAPTWLPLT